MLFAALVISTSSVWVKIANMGATAIGFYRMSIGGLLLVILCLLQSKRLPLSNGWFWVPFSLQLTCGFGTAPSNLLGQV